MLDAVQLVDFNRDAEEIESFLAQKEAQLASGSAGTWMGAPPGRAPPAGPPVLTVTVPFAPGLGFAAGDSLDAVHANQKKHDRLEQELAQEEGKLKALNNLGQAVRAQPDRTASLVQAAANFWRARFLRCGIDRPADQRRPHRQCSDRRAP